jgi:hypothetical protein
MVNLRAVVRATPDDLATPMSKAFMEAYQSPGVEGLTYATGQVDKALRQSTTGWGGTPQSHVTRALKTIDKLPQLKSTEGTEKTLFASELLRNTMAGRGGNLYEVLDFRRAALIQSREALATAAEREVATILASQRA